MFFFLEQIQFHLVHHERGFALDRNFDIVIGFERPQRIEAIEAQVESFPGVVFAEALRIDGSIVPEPAGLNVMGLLICGTLFGARRRGSARSIRKR